MNRSKRCTLRGVQLVFVCKDITKSVEDQLRQEFGRLGIVEVISFERMEDTMVIKALIATSYDLIHLMIESTVSRISDIVDC